MAVYTASKTSQFGNISVKATGNIASALTATEKINSLAVIAKDINSSPQGIISASKILPFLLPSIGAPIAIASTIFSTLFSFFKKPSKKTALQNINTSIIAVSNQITSSTKFLSSQIAQSTNKIINLFTASNVNQTIYTKRLNEIVNIQFAKNNQIINSEFTATQNAVATINTDIILQQNKIIDTAISADNLLIQKTIDNIFLNSQNMRTSIVNQINAKIDADKRLLLEIAKRKKYELELKNFDINAYFIIFKQDADRYFLTKKFRFLPK